MNIRKYAKERNIDIASLVDILETRRPYPSVGEINFINKYLSFCHKDECGNCWYIVGDEPPTVLWSAHTDTVTAKDGRQNVMWDNNIIRLSNGKAGQSLGADDGAGMWLLIEMIKAGVPGLYVFHRGEERGGIGSSWIVKNTPRLVDGIKYAIAFDRKATHSIITHQSWARCCSDDFAKAFAGALNAQGLKYELDDTGSFTDTANYTDLIAECTNVSVGYSNEHGPRESLDVEHLLKLREAMLNIDVTTFPAVRDPSVTEYLETNYYGKYWDKPKPKVAKDEMVQLIQDFPEEVAAIFKSWGWDKDELESEIDSVIGPSFDYEDEPDMKCEDCNATFATIYSMPIGGERCPECNSDKTWPLLEMTQ